MYKVKSNIPDMKLVTHLSEKVQTLVPGMTSKVTGEIYISVVTTWLSKKDLCVLIQNLVCFPGEAPAFNVHNKHCGFYSLFIICIRKDRNKLHVVSFLPCTL